MGSDLYMEQQNWRPRPSKVTWLDEETIKVERDAFYTGYFTVYEGKVTPEVTVLLRGLGIKLPDKDPTVLFVDQKYRVRISGKESGLNEDVVGDLFTDIDRAFKRATATLKRKYPRLEIEIG